MRDMEAFRRLVYDKADRALAERRRKRGIALRIGSSVAVICVVCGAFLYNRLSPSKVAPECADLAYAEAELIGDGKALTEYAASQKMFAYSSFGSATAGTEAPEAVYRDDLDDLAAVCGEDKSDTMSLLVMNSFSSEAHLLDCDVAYAEDSVRITVYVDQTPTENGEYILTVPVSLKDEFSEEDIEEVWITK